MRERLDCAVVLTRCTFEWVQPLLGAHAGGRLHLHGFDQVIDIGSEGAHTMLAAASMGLRRHDACLLPVSPATLSWARISLAQSREKLHTPVMALVRDLTAAGLHDLCELGIVDFLRDPFCGHEARVRIERLLDRRRMAFPSASSRQATVGVDTSASRYAVEDAALNRVCDTILDHGGQELEAYAIAAASRLATSRESFRDAKSKVIERFERAYINAALGRHAGNIAMAARAAQKHRRAFWALMRKHDIDAAPFRAQAGSEMPQLAAQRRSDHGDHAMSLPGAIRSAALSVYRAPNVQGR